MASPLIPQLGKPSGNERKEWRAVPSDQATPRGCEQWTTCLWTRQFRCPWQVSRDPDQKVNGLMIKTKAFQDFPGGSDSKEYTYSEGDPGSIPGSRRLPWRREWQPAPVFLPGESHGQRNLVGYCPTGCKESNTTEQLTLTRLSQGLNTWVFLYPLFAVNLLNHHSQAVNILLAPFYR